MSLGFFSGQTKVRHELNRSDCFFLLDWGSWVDYVGFRGWTCLSAFREGIDHCSPPTLMYLRGHNWHVSRHNQMGIDNPKKEQRNHNQSVLKLTATTNSLSLSHAHTHALITRTCSLQRQLDQIQNACLPD